MVQKIIVSDFDNTFYINDNDVKKNKVAVDEFIKVGNIFIIATGRSYSDFKVGVDSFDIKYNYAILNHGTTIIDNKDNIIYNKPMNQNIIEKIKNDINLENVAVYFCCCELKSSENINHRNITKINIHYKTKEEKEYIKEKLEQKYSDEINVYDVELDTIEIVSNEVDKSKAISLLLDKINKNERNVYTIGDGYSDIEMVKEFNGFCMKESIEELKQYANKEYSSVSDFIKEVMEKTNE